VSNISLELTDAEALVLFDWLARFNASDAHPFEDQAEQRVLWDLAAMLESRLVAPLSPDYKRLLSDARAAVRDREG
jgi:hypothetical protein